MRFKGKFHKIMINLFFKIMKAVQAKNRLRAIFLLCQILIQGFKNFRLGNISLLIKRLPIIKLVIISGNIKILANLTDILPPPQEFENLCD